MTVALPCARHEGARQHAMTLRIATFNVENLLSRKRFGPMARPDAAAAMALFGFEEQERETAERALSVTLEDDKRQMTALAIAETHADILCLQEVDNLSVLEAFFANYVHRISDIRYGHFRLVRGNDERGIDVAFACRRDLVARGDIRHRSHRDETHESLGVFSDALAALGRRPDEPLFKRDCLELDLTIAGERLGVFVCHFKSMANGKDDGRAATAPIRRAEARGVAEIIRRRHGPAWREAHWVVAGDLNDYRERLVDGETVPARPSGIDPLFDGFAVDPSASLPARQRWTHFHRDWSDGERRMIEEHVQLDYVLLSPALAAGGARVEIIRRGLPYRVPLDPGAPDRSIAALSTAGGRYPRVGWDRPKASDHCPVVVEVPWPPVG